MSQQNCNQTLRRVTKFVILSLVLRAEYTFFVQINVYVRAKKTNSSYKSNPQNYVSPSILLCYFISWLRLYRDHCNLQFTKFPLTVEIYLTILFIGRPDYCKFIGFQRMFFEDRSKREYLCYGS